MQFSVTSAHGQVGPRVGHLCVDLSGDAGRYNVEVDVVLLIQAEVAVTHHVQSVDISEEQ